MLKITHRKKNPNSMLYFKFDFVFVLYVCLFFTVHSKSRYSLCRIGNLAFIYRQKTMWTFFFFISFHFNFIFNIKSTRCANYRRLLEKVISLWTFRSDLNSTDKIRYLSDSWLWLMLFFRVAVFNLSVIISIEIILWLKLKISMISLLCWTIWSFITHTSYFGILWSQKYGIL